MLPGSEQIPFLDPYSVKGMAKSSSRICSKNDSNPLCLNHIEKGQRCGLWSRQQSPSRWADAGLLLNVVFCGLSYKMCSRTLLQYTSALFKLSRVARVMYSCIARPKTCTATSGQLSATQAALESLGISIVADEDVLG